MKRILLVALAGVLISGLLLALWAFWLEPRSLVPREVTVRIDEWSSPSPLRVAVLADLHVGSPFNGEKSLRRAVQTANELKPDLVVLLGDFVIQGVAGGSFVPPESIAPVLGELRAPLGTFAVLGNHDWWLDAPRVRAALERAGITVLEDQASPLLAAGKRFWLVGISDFLEGPHDVASALAKVQGDDPVVAITHNPDVFPMIPERVALTIAGHTHGGQVAIPLAGRPIVPSRYGERYAIGHVVESGRDLYVSSGIGTSILPVRFRVPPEVVLLTIRGPDGQSARR